MAVPSYRLLVVDDSKRDTLLLERILQQASDATFTVTHMESAKAGLECTLDVTQATGGSVLNVTIGTCNGDQAVRESVANAVYRSSPLPAPRDARAFQRRLVIVFKPTE